MRAEPYLSIVVFSIPRVGAEGMGAGQAGSSGQEPCTRPGSSVWRGVAGRAVPTPRRVWGSSVSSPDGELSFCPDPTSTPYGRTNWKWWVQQHTPHGHAFSQGSSFPGIIITVHI